MQGMTGNSRDVLRFGGFELDIRAYELRRDGQALRLEQQPMDLLILLVERRPELVLRTEIVERLWGRDTFVDAEAGINTLVRKIRQVLKDSATAPVFIERVPGKGYRFIAPVEVARVDDRGVESGSGALVRPPAAASTSGAVPVEDRANRRRAWPVAALAALTVLIALATAAYWLSGSREVNEGGAADGTVSLAVLPFETIAAAPGREHLADALHEETTIALRQVEPAHFEVVPRPATLKYGKSVQSPAEIGRELAVEYLIQGAVQAENTRVRITASLIRVHDQWLVKSWRFEYEPRRLLEFQRELSAAIAEQISVTLSPARLEALARRHSRDPDAQDLYFRGQSYWNQLTPASTQRAIEYFESATRRDPGYALPWAGIALAYAAAPINADAVPLEVWPKARDAADRAIRADATLAEAQTGLGIVQFWLDWDWPAAEASFVRAVEADPRYGLAQRMLGIVRSHMGNHLAAASSMRRLRELEPMEAMNHALSAQVAFNARDFTTARDHANQAALVDPAFWIAHYQAALALEQLGEYESALKAIGPVTHVNSKALSLEGYLLAKSGRTADARRVLSTLEQTAGTGYLPPYAIALVHAGLGEREAALRRLEQGLDVHDVHLAALPVDPKWDSFRQDARFAAIVERCGFTRQRP